ncbi:hypothetical protein JIN84_08890 [Luteolibacter yonseiensis]|uniref:Uncharacterized protein n=1 Tax=Luteolibacter yonseiensis TaxID=1144680 RepID=A0A934R3Q4_9BACT|nr:hypothetical protein [Luteolibacter yonseiensis]MBK1815731.1 hypothetical protein [Luteolibacter yonseiensis]
MIRIEIGTGNEAFRPGQAEGWRQEAAWLLHDLADRIHSGRALPLVLRDYNGNRVGLAELEPETISAPAGERETA